jgi:hypothetical protein
MKTNSYYFLLLKRNRIAKKIKDLCKRLNTDDPDAIFEMMLKHLNSLTLDCVDLSDRLQKFDIGPEPGRNQNDNNL